MKRAMITGILGQDGSYLAEYLLKKKYEVFGILRRYYHHLLPPPINMVEGVHYYYGDMRDEVSLETAIRKIHPDEIYNLAGQVFVPTSWTKPADTIDVNTNGLARILNIVENVCPKCRVYQASSSEMFGNTLRGKTGIIALDENSPMNPVSPYGVSKYAAHKLADVYRQKGLFVVSGILFNHESPRRGQEMVTRKITRTIGAWKSGDTSELRLGNSNSKRDWGFAGDYVEAMHLMLQQDTPEDFVIGTGKAHSIEDFINTACKVSGIASYKVKFNCPEFTRKNELNTLVADYRKARIMLKWEPKHSFEELVTMMVNSDIEYFHKLNEIGEGVCTAN